MSMHCFYRPVLPECVFSPHSQYLLYMRRSDMAVSEDLKHERAEAALSQT